MQCLRTYDMETLKQYMERKNLDDANLAELLKYIIAEAELTVGELFDDQDILDHVHDGGMPIDEIFGEDEVLGCGCVIDAIAQEREDCEQETVEKYEEEIEEYQSQVGQLEETIGDLHNQVGQLEDYIGELKNEIAQMKKTTAELDRKLAVSNEALVCLGYRVDDEPCAVVSEEE